MIWEYGKLMLEQEDIDSLDNWSDEKEFAYSTMDRKFDYLWSEHNKGIWFIDRLYASGMSDELTEKKKENNELILYFNNIFDVMRWIINKKERETYAKIN